MKALVLAAALLACAASTCLAQGKPPLEIAGFRLGDTVEKYAARLDREITEEEIGRQFLTVSALLPVAGFRSGYVTYGNCAAPGRIVRLKMNYEDGTREFFERLLAAMKARYGEPAEWRGNPFGSLRTWKWSFKDPSVGDISLILQHYSGTDDAFTRGNSLRLSAHSLATAEQDCYFAKHPDRVARIVPKLPKPDFEALLPR